MRTVIFTEDRPSDVKRTAEEIRVRYLLDHAGRNASFAQRILHHAVLDVKVSGDAFKQLFASLPFCNNADASNFFVSNETMGKLLGKTPRSVERCFEQLEERGYVTSKRRKNDSSLRKFDIAPDTLRVANELIDLMRQNAETTQTSFVNREATQASFVSPETTLMASRNDANVALPLKTRPLKEDSGRRPAKCASAKTATGGERASVAEEALALYNQAACAHGFAGCHSFTNERRRRLEKRIADIGGIEQFALALSAIPRDDFLMGRLPPKPGQQNRFKLSIDRLLYTDGGLGDVLARLIDSAINAGTNARNNLDATIDAEVQQLAQSKTGKQTLAHLGYEKGMEKLRRHVEQQLAKSVAA